LTGVKLAWKSPPRHDAATGLGEALRRHALGSVFALTWIGVILVSSAAFQWWLSPVLAGLLLAIPISAWTSRAAPGRWLKARGLFLIPEERMQPAVLAEADRYAAAFGATPGFADAVTDAAVQAEVLRSIPARPAARGAKAQAQTRLVARAASEGPRALTQADRLRLLASAQALRALHDRVLAGGAHRDWPVYPALTDPASVVESAPSPLDSIVSAH